MTPLIQSTGCWSEKVASNSLVTHLASTTFKVIMQFCMLEKVARSLTKAQLAKECKAKFIKNKCNMLQQSINKALCVQSWMLQPTRHEPWRRTTICNHYASPRRQCVGMPCIGVLLQNLVYEVIFFIPFSTAMPNDRRVYYSFLFMLI